MLKIDAFFASFDNRQELGEPKPLITIGDPPIQDICHPYDGPWNGHPSELDYITEDKCDSCNETAFGIMHYARGATGRVCPVLFLCNECEKGIQS